MKRRLGRNFLEVWSLVLPDRLDSLSFDRIIITSINEDDTVMEKLLKKGISRNKIVMLE